MKLLLTGKPKSGKTTLLEGFINTIDDKQGFVAREVRENGERIGFELVSSHGQTVTLANVNSRSEIRVSRYGVEVDSLDDFIIDLPCIKENSLIYIDEIGQMELFSDKFKALVMSYLNTNNFYAGTITSVFKDDFIEQVLSRDDILLLEIGQNNREQMRDVMSGLVANIELLQKLSPTANYKLTEMARSYAKSGSLIQLKKLFKNALKYAAEGKVKKIAAHSYMVKGNANEHTVSDLDEWSCDCNLFKGAGSYEGQAGECSHIQAVKLSLSV